MNRNEQSDALKNKVKTISDQFYAESYKKLCSDNDKVFAILLGLQWVGAIIVAMVVSPQTWIGERGQVHAHIWFATIFCGLLSAFPIYMNLKKPGAVPNRYINVIAQGIYSAIFIHLTGGRIETHFHVFGSLAFFAFYRDIKVLLTGTVIVAVDHLIRGVFFPESAFGIITATEWRWVEHAGWVVFEDFFLAYACVRGIQEMKVVAEKRAEVTIQHELAEELVQRRTGELQAERNELQKRNATIENIYANVKSGFLVVNRDGYIEDGFTDSCKTLIGPSVKPGEKFSTALQLKDERSANHFQLMLDQVFEDILPEDVSLDQVPSKHFIGTKVLKVEGGVVRGRDKGVESVLFTINDITELQQTEQANQTNIALIKILQQREAFCHFLADAKGLIQDCRTAVEKDDKKRLKFMLHTIKGNSSVFGLEEIVHLVHETEEMEKVDLNAIKKIDQAFKDFLARHESVLNIQYDSEVKPIYTVTQQQLGFLNKSIRSPEVSEWIKSVRRKEANKALGGLTNLGISIARRLDKDVDFDIANPTFMIDADYLRPVFQNLSHMVRNSLDHGIEPSSQRGSKPKKAKISFKFGLENGNWVIEVSDDGKGIDTEKVAKKAMELGYVKEKDLKTMSKTDIEKLIFKDGLSTAQSVTYLSGRGVGMSAMLSAVHSLGGDITLTNSPGKGVAFKITVPIDPHEAEGVSQAGGKPAKTNGSRAVA